MATTAAARPRGKVRTDDVFFSGMAVVAVVAVLVGFARTYFLVGMFRAPLPNLLVHVHGAVFMLWILVFVSQIGLVTTRRIALHRRIGLYAFGLAASMVVLGLLVASDHLARHVGETPQDTPEQVRAFYAIPVAAILLFATFAALGYRERGHPAVHKRLMLFATFALIEAAFDRWPVFDPYPLWLVQLVPFVPLVLITMAYDRWSTGKVQRVTLWSSVLLLSVQQLSHPFAHTAVWQTIAGFVETHMHAFH